MKEWDVWSTGRRGRITRKVLADLDYVIPHAIGPAYARAREAAVASMRTALMPRSGISDVTLQEQTAPMASFMALQHSRERRQNRWVLVFPPLFRFFDLRNEPTVEPESLACGRWIWIQPDVFEKTGYVFQGHDHPFATKNVDESAVDDLVPIDVRTLQTLDHFLVALDRFLETR